MTRSGAAILTAYLMLYVTMFILFPKVMLIILLGSVLFTIGIVCRLSFQKPEGESGVVR